MAPHKPKEAYIVELVDLIEAVLKLARLSAKSQEDLEVCAALEDFATNHLGDE